MEKIIQLKKMGKRFSGVSILEDVDLSIFKGDSIALIGHNGSGKSTLLKIIAGLENCSFGSVEKSRDLKFQYIPEVFPISNLTGGQYLKHMGKIEGMSRVDIEKEIDRYTKIFFLEDMMSKPMKYLSKGTLQKIGVVQALMCECDVILLDEPLSGQDIDSQKAFIQLIRERNTNGCTIIMSCHEPHLVQEISKRVIHIEARKIKEKKEYFNKPREMMPYEDCLYNWIL